MFEFAHEAMATSFRLRIADVTERLARQAAQSAWMELARLESLLSRFVDGADISRINHAPPGELVRVNADTLHCLELALELAEQTGGAFDPALGRWTGGDGSTDRTGGRDAANRQHPALILDRPNFSATRTREDVLVDLGGIGKGFAIDVLALFLRDWEIPSACLDAGGSTVLAYGRPAHSPPWCAQVAARKIPLRNAAIAGSGTGVKGAHIVDGRTGECCERKTRVWSFAPSAAEADALSTAFFAFSNDEIECFCARHPRYGAAWLTASESLSGSGQLTRILHPSKNDAAQ